MKKKQNRTKSNRLVPVDINKQVQCKNLKYGCNLRAKPYTCLRRYKTTKNKKSPDVINFTNRKRGTRKLKIPLLKAIDWFNCSHFPK